jgi:replicative DNA helicase
MTQNQNLDRLPPHDEQNEAAAIGCALLDSSCIDVLLSTAKEHDFFYDLRHQIILSKIRALRESFQPVTVLSVATELRHSNQLEEAGGMVYLSTLPDSTPSAAHLEYSLEVLRKKFIARRMIAACTEAAAQAYDHKGEADELIEAFRTRVNEAGTLIDAKEAQPAKVVLRRCVDRYERMLAGEETGIQTGYTAIDASGGLQMGELVLVCGQTGLGKSTFALNLVHSALRNSIPVALFSLEMSDEAWMDRLIALDLDIDRRAFRSRSIFTENVMRRIAVNMPRLSKLPLWLCDDAQSTVEDIRRVSKLLVERQRVRLVVVDYAQIVTPPRSIDSREQQVAYIGRSLRALAQETRCVFIVLSQLNDEGKVRESRALLHEAHVCIKLEERENNVIWAVCAKGRDTQFPSFPLEFDALTCSMKQASQTE